MSVGRIKLDLDTILQGYGFLTMLPSSDLLNFGLKVTIIALTNFSKQFAFGLD